LHRPGDAGTGPEQDGTKAQDAQSDRRYSRTARQYARGLSLVVYLSSTARRIRRRQTVRDAAQDAPRESSGTVGFLDRRARPAEVSTRDDCRSAARAACGIVLERLSDPETRPRSSLGLLQVVALPEIPVQLETEEVEGQPPADRRPSVEQAAILSE